jgi:hypothetical protein
MSYLIHHRKLKLVGVLISGNDDIFREEEDQGYYLQSIVPFTEFESVAIFRRDVPDDRLPNE